MAEMQQEGKVADIGLRSGKVRAGFYRSGPYCIHKGPVSWGIYKGAEFITTRRSLAAAYFWCRQQSTSTT